MQKEDHSGVSITISENNYDKNIIKPSKKRFFILLIFMLLTGISAFQGIFLASINGFVAIYYEVDHLAINFISIVSMSLNVLLSLPITWIMERIGMKNSIVIGSLGAAGSTLIRCLSYRPEGYWFIMAANVFAITQLFFSSASSRIATVWFPEHQVSRATSMSVISMELGFALGYILPSRLVGPDPYNTEYVSTALISTYGILSAVLIIISLVTIVYFDEQPKNAPSIARFKQMKIEKEEKFDSLLSHMKNQLKLLQAFLLDKNFRLLFIAFGLIEGVNYSFHIILNQIIGQMHSVESVEKLVSYTGLILIISGFLSSLICGYLLDKYQRYKLTTLTVYLWTILTLILFIASLRSGSSIAVYVSAFLIGLSRTGYSTVGYKYAAEITFPKPELVSATLLYLSAFLFGIPISLIGSLIVDNHGFIALGLFYMLILLIGLFTDCLQDGELKRQKAQETEQITVMTKTATKLYSSTC